MSVNTFAVNDSALNGSNPPIETNNDLISFGGFGLCNTTYVVMNSSSIRDTGNIDINTQGKPQSDGQFIYNQIITEKEFTIDCAIIGTSKTDLMTKIDIFKRNMYKKEGLLELSVAGEVRVAKCYTSGIDNFEIDKYKATCSVTLFMGDDPFFYSKNPVSKSYLNITSNINGSVYNSGVYKSFPRYVFLFKSGITDLNEIKILLGGYTLTINETISDNDVLIVDSKNQLITLNSIDIVDYDGPTRMPFEIDNNPLEIQFESGSTFDVDITIIYNNNYL